MMLGENAAKLYNIDLEVLRSLAQEFSITPAEVAVPVPLDKIPADSTCITFQRAKAMEMWSAGKS